MKHRRVKAGDQILSRIFRKGVSVGPHTWVPVNSPLSARVTLPVWEEVGQLVHAEIWTGVAVKAGEQIDRRDIYEPSRSVAERLAFRAHRQVFYLMGAGVNQGAGNLGRILDRIFDQIRSDVREER